MIIGLTGTNGSGKGTIAKYLMAKGFTYHSCSDVIREEADKRGLEKNRDELQKLANSLRKEHGENILAKRLLAKIKENKEEKTIVDSIRNPAEIKELKKEKFILIAVDAPIELRYERITKRQRPEDKVSFEKFKTQEEREMKGGKTEQQIINCMEIADYKIINDSTIQKLQLKIDKILEVI